MSRSGATGGIISATSTNGKLRSVPAICLIFAGIETLELLRLILVIKIIKSISGERRVSRDNYLMVKG